ncbi:MAG: lectin-like domain-containing protein, partial [Actinomycetota bacterium]
MSDTVGSITGAGTISLGSATLTSGSAGTTSFSGAITGTGNIIKTGSATTLTLSGTNSYSGTTTIAADGGNLTVSGTLGTSSSYAGNVVINSSTSTFTFSNAASGTTQTLSGVISGDGIVAKSGASTLKLSGSSDNTYTGATNVTAGVLSVAKNVALGTTAGITAVSGTGAVHFDGSGLSISEPFTIAASGSGTGALLNLANSNTVTGAVTLSAAATIGSTTGILTFNVSSDNAFDATSGTPAITFTGAGNITVSDPIDTPISTFAKSGTGVLLTEAVNAYTGSTTISAGTLRLSGSGSIPDSSAVSVTGSGIYDLNSVSDTVGSISSSGSSTSAMTGDACGRTTTGSDFAEPAASVAVESPTGTWRLTPDLNSQFGAIWNSTQWNTNFDLCIRAQVYLGVNDGGADGLAFVLQPNNTAQGSSGGGLGYAGISPSFALEFDTWVNAGDMANDHAGLMKNGSVSDHSQWGVAAVDLGNIEDGQWRYFKLNWDSATKKMSVLFDRNADGDLDDSGELIFNSVDVDLQSVFATGTAYWGFTAATGGARNLQQVRDITYDVVTENQTGPQITLGTAQLTSGGNNGTTTFAGVISGSDGSMVKTGTGTLTLSNANTYTSTTAINAGAIAISNNKALGDDNTTKSSTSVASGAALLVSGGLTGVTDPITINGAGIS